MWIADGWKDYEVIDTSSGEKLERWGDYILLRPDPQVIWNTKREHPLYKKLNGHYHRSTKGGGEWEFFDLPTEWSINYKDLTFNLKPFSFKHTGLFPEQATNWDWFSSIIKREKGKNPEREIKVLNLFAYTGGATMACSKAGAKEVVHVDASKGMIQWAKENMQLSNLQDRTIRFIVDDCIKFVKREQRRGRKYDGIVMDPPSYGRGPNGELWKLEEELFPLIQECMKILSDDALFFIVNCYTTGFSCSTLNEALSRSIQKEKGGHIECGENLLPVTTNNSVLPCGIFGRWTND